MNAGKMRHSITIEQETRSVDTGGGASNTWAAITDGVRWAWIDPVSSRGWGTYGEKWSAYQLSEYISHVIGTRYISTVTTAMRISWNSRIFDIRMIIHTDENQKETIMLCQERKAV